MAKTATANKAESIDEETGEVTIDGQPTTQEEIDFQGWKDTRYPFWVVATGATVYGEVVGVLKEVSGKFGERDMLEVMLLRPAKARMAKKAIEVPKGNIIRVEVRKAMGDLCAYLSEGDKVYIECKGKVPTDKGNDAWIFDVKYKTKS